jgi:hypothetical protein
MWVKTFMLADFGETWCSLLLVILTTLPGNAVWWKKADLQHGGGNTQFTCRSIWPLYCKVVV